MCVCVCVCVCERERAVFAFVDILHFCKKFEGHLRKWNVTTLIREGGGVIFFQHFIAPPLGVNAR